MCRPLPLRLPSCKGRTAHGVCLLLWTIACERSRVMAGVGLMRLLGRKCGILLGLVAAHIALHALCWHVSPSPDRVIAALLFMVVPTEGALVGVGMTMGGRKQLPWWLAIGIALVFAFASGCESGLFGTPLPDPAYLPLLIGQVICVSAVLLLMRPMGLQIVSADAPVECPGRFQFSLLDIFNWTTAIAALLAFFKCLPQGAVQIVRPGDRGTACLVNAVSTMLAMASIWLVFGKRRFALRCLVCVIAVFLAAIVLVFCTSESLLYFLFVFTAHAGWLIASLIAVRLAGFRFVWRSRRSVTPPPADPIVGQAPRA